MIQIQQSTLQFLSDIKRHNEREWFQANYKRYEDARKNFEVFVQAIIDEITGFEPVLKGLEAKSCTYRINRDIRFSNDKTIYKTNMGAFITKGGKKNGDRLAGYYVHIEPGGNSMLAGGAYMPPMPWLTAIRNKISEDGNSFIKIISNRDFKSFFGSIDGERLKSAPKGFDRDDKYIGYLKMKSFLAAKTFSDRDIIEKNWFDTIIEGARILKPFNDFLNDYQEQA